MDEREVKDRVQRKATRTTWRLPKLETVVSVSSLIAAVVALYVAIETLDITRESVLADRRISLCVELRSNAYEVRYRFGERLGYLTEEYTNENPIARQSFRDRGTAEQRLAEDSALRFRLSTAFEYYGPENLALAETKLEDAVNRLEAAARGRVFAATRIAATDPWSVGDLSDNWHEFDAALGEFERECKTTFSRFGGGVDRGRSPVDELPTTSE